MADQKQQTNKGKALRVRTAGSVASFRRAGYTFGPEPTDIPLAELKDGKREVIEAEPMLRTEEVEGGK